MSKDKYDVIEISIPLFGMYLELFLSPFSKIGEWAEEEFGCKLSDLETDETEADGLTINLRDAGTDGFIIVALKDFRRRLKKKHNAAIGVLAHECLHATKAIFESRGVPFTPENEEVIAYMQEHLVESSLDALTNRRKKHEDTDDE